MTLIEQIQQVQQFTEIDPIVIPCARNTIRLKRYETTIEDEKSLYPTRIILSEMHDGQKEIPNEFRVTIFDAEDDFGEGIELFAFSEPDKLFRFIDLIILP